MHVNRLFTVNPSCFQNYAQDALKDVLGWYGLQESGVDGGGAGGGGAAHTARKLSLLTSHAARRQILTTHQGPENIGDSQKDRNARQENDDRPGYNVAENGGNMTPTSTDTTTENKTVKSEVPLDLTNGHATATEVAQTGKWCSSCFYFVLENNQDFNDNFIC